jgi:EAL domain-containing protein (putative c-di-GMP-specific phosphodiesterase class I)
MRLVAEGVESQSDAETLAVLGCDLAQGYYVSRPLSAASFEQWMAANSPFTAIVPSVSRSSGMTVAGV